MALGDMIYDAFGGYGDIGVILCIFLIFLVDAMLFPMLPEMFFILGYNYDPTTEFGATLIATAMCAELVGSFTLCYVVKHVRVPARVSKIANSYMDFLMEGDEKVILANRITHMVPYVGAFMGLMTQWDLRKCAIYIAVGCVIKYTVILAASSFFLDFFSGQTATFVTMGIVMVTLCICTALSIYRKKKRGIIE